MATGRINDYTKRYKKIGLLFIEPKNNPSANPIIDKAVEIMKTAMSKAEKRGRYKGWHDCSCGKKSDNVDYIIGKFVTNSLAIHYLMDHREEVPEDELNDVMSLDAF